MSFDGTIPTAYPDVNALLSELLSGVQSILGNHLIGMYLFGSLAMGDFDTSSDIDVAVVTDEEISPELFAELYAMHARIAGIDSPWATQLEVSYLSLHNLRRYDPQHSLHPHLDRDKGEKLGMQRHARVVERHVLRERGIVLIGPSPRELIDPISPDDLRRAVLEVVDEWLRPMLDAPTPFTGRGYQSYTVLSICRMLYTLEHGEIVSKPTAARWAQAKLDERWSPLIERALAGRHTPYLDPDADDVNETRALMRYMLERRQQIA